jgi:PleD family two-component response regulator
MPRSSDINSQGESLSSAVSCEMPKVLIADDSRFQRQMLASFLLPKKFEVIFAVDALQTWMMALRSSPDLILLDIKCREARGLSAQTPPRIQQNPANSRHRS